MNDSISINKEQSKEEIYKSLIPQLSSLLVTEEPVISSLANVTAVLKESFNKISWVGFYWKSNDRLLLGPFQGKVACTIIDIGSGVCGTSAANNETIIVEDVEKFPGHIACDAGSKSEIVVPLIVDDKLFGVLDLDSYSYSSFDEIDKLYLEIICELITEKLDLRKFILT